jgi:hypothetical protein
MASSRTHVPYFTMLSIGTFLAVLHYFYRSDRGYFIATLYLSAHYVSIVLGAAALEYYGYTPQLGYSGSPEGATIRLVLYYQLFLLVGLASYKWVGGVIDTHSFRTRLISRTRFFRSYVVLVLFLSLLFGWSFLVAGTAFEFGFDRIEYRRYAEQAAFGGAFGYENLISIVAAVGATAGFYYGLLVDASRRSRLLCNAAALALIVILVLSGEKFSTLFLFLSLFLGGLFASRPRFFRTAKWLRLPAFFLVLAGSLVGLFFYLQEADVLYSLARRLNLQGQLSVYMDSRLLAGDLRADVLALFQNEIFGSRIREYGSHGMSLLVREASDSEVYQQFEESNAGFTDGFPAIVMFYFGWGYWLTAIPAGMLMGAGARMYFSRFIGAHPIFALVGFVLIYRPLAGAFINGTLYSLVPVSNTALLFAAVGLLIVVFGKAATPTARSQYGPGLPATGTAIFPSKAS